MQEIKKQKQSERILALQRSFLLLCLGGRKRQYRRECFLLGYQKTCTCWPAALDEALAEVKFATRLSSFFFTEKNVGRGWPSNWATYGSVLGKTIGPAPRRRPKNATATKPPRTAREALRAARTRSPARGRKRPFLRRPGPASG